MTQSIETFKATCAKWKTGLERLLVILPLSFVAGFIGGFWGGKQDVLESKVIDGVNQFERIEFIASVVIPFVLIYIYLFMIRNILTYFAKGEFFHQAVFEKIAKIGQVSLVYGSLVMPLILVVLMWVFAADYTAFDVLVAYVDGMDFISIVLGVMLLLIGHVLRVARVYYEEQQLTI